MPISHTATQLSRKIQAQQALIGVIGLGYAGLPLALRFAEAGFQVIGLDIDSEKIDRLNAGESYIAHLAAERIAQVASNGKLIATNNFKAAHRCDALIICVPTPLGVHHEPDLSYIKGTMESLAPHLRTGQVISLESTTYPGTTEEEVSRHLDERQLVIGEDVFLIYSPEREDPGNKEFETRSIPKIVGGATPTCLEIGCHLYGGIIERVVPVSSLRVAEMAKLLENIYRAVNIGLVNELKIVADRMGIDIWEVIDAAATKPFGFTPFYPGLGPGGHCIPVDPFYLTWKAREYDLHTRFIELAGEVNEGMPRWVAAKIGEALNEQKIAMNGAKILVLGIAYKKNVDDTRESPSIELMEILRHRGAHIEYSDPHVPNFPPMRAHHFDLASKTLTPENMREVDCVVIATDHDAFEYDFIQQHSRLIVDIRGRFRGSYPNVVKC